VNTLPLFSTITETEDGRARARAIKLVGLDVDGVLTDGGIYLGDVNGQPLELKKYDIQDGLGMKMLQKAGIAVAIITGRVSESVAIRARELAVDELVQDRHARKLISLREIATRRGISMDEIAFVGDDLPDVGVLRVVGLPVVVANGSPDACAVARYRLSRTGGTGAVREFAEALLKARGEWQAIADHYVASREATRDAEGVVS
jgi:3-deoxy-D-manno-octulosonate 8-phosphate phosphatase (KDO 8-P phosphatase)